MSSKIDVHIFTFLNETSKHSLPFGVGMEGIQTGLSEGTVEGRRSGASGVSAGEAQDLCVWTHS